MNKYYSILFLLFSIIVISVFFYQKTKPDIIAERMWLGSLFFDLGRLEMTHLGGQLQGARYLIITHQDNLDPSYKNWIQEVHKEEDMDFLKDHFREFFQTLESKGIELKHPIRMDHVEGNLVVFAWSTNDEIFIGLNR